jgi:hypothetical protein
MGPGAAPDHCEAAEKTGPVHCWDVRSCLVEARGQCAAFLDPSRPCWEQRTLCKETFGIDTCFVCKVYLQYGPQSDPGAARSRK